MESMHRSRSNSSMCDHLAKKQVEKKRFLGYYVDGVGILKRGLTIEEEGAREKPVIGE